MIKIKNLNFAYRPYKIFQDLNLDLISGNIYALIGRNGSGKTTLFDLLMKNLNPQKGSIEIQGALGYLPQNFILPSRMKIIEAIEFIYLLNANLNIPFEEVIQRYSFNGLCRFDNIKDKQIRNLSNGELKWLGIYLTLARDDDIYLLDEPTDGVDPEFRYDILNGIKRKAEEKKSLFIISSHLLNEMSPYIGEILFIKNQNIIKFLSVLNFIEEFQGKHADEAFVKAYQSETYQRKLSVR
jgi:ABC-2 type transport system ATP-binding protein